MKDLQVVLMTYCKITVSIGVFCLKSDAEQFIKNLLAARGLKYKKQNGAYVVDVCGAPEIYTIESTPMNPTI